MVRVKLLVAAFLALVMVASPGGGSRALAQGAAPYELSVILSLVGQVAYAGKDEQQAITTIEGVVNRTGGIQGHPLKIVYYDDQSSPQIAVQLLNQLTARNVPVVIGPMFTATCSSTAPLVEKSGPVMYCLTPGYQPARGSYVFVPVTRNSDMDEALLRYCLTRHWTRMAVLTTTDATGQVTLAGVQEHLKQPEFSSIKLVALESMNASDLSAGAQLQRIKATQPDILFVTGSGPPYGTALRGLTDAGMNGLPVATQSANMTLSSMQSYKDYLPKTVLFTASRGTAISATPKGPVLDAQRTYFTSMDAAHVKPEGVNVLVWDPLWIVIDALRHIGPKATAGQIHDYVENLHGWAGVSGVYDFTDGSQRGIGAQSVVVFQWNPARNDFVPVSGPGGAALAGSR